MSLNGERLKRGAVAHHHCYSRMLVDPESLRAEEESQRRLDKMASAPSLDSRRDGLLVMPQWRCTARPHRVTVMQGGDAPVERVCCGAEHTLALDREGRLWAFGRGDYGQLGRGTAEKQSNPFPAVAATQRAGSAKPSAEVRSAFPASQPCCFVSWWAGGGPLPSVIPRVVHSTAAARSPPAGRREARRRRLRHVPPRSVYRRTAR
jgi:hypothetical protein